MEKIRCDNCGAEIEDGKYCENCKPPMEEEEKEKKRSERKQKK